MDAYEIAVLAEDYENKRLRVEAMRMRNMAGLSAEETVKANVDYHVAEAEAFEAWRKLEEAKLGIKG